MKRTLLFIACVLASITMQVHAEGEYESLLSEGKTWTMSYRSPYQEGKVNYVESKLEGDTIIGDVTFKRKYDREWKQGDATPQEWKATDYYVGEDGGKVYYYYKVLNDEPQLLMDFSAKVDDVIPVQIEGTPSGIKVVSVDNTILGSSTDQTRRRCLDVRDTWHDRSDTWIEGIGSMTFGIENYFMNMLTGGIPKFIKCQYNGQTLYEDDAQEEQNNYIPFVKGGKSWHVVRSTAGQDKMEEIDYKIQQGVEEVIIDGNLEGRTFYKLDRFFIREENRKVYLKDPSLGVEFLMFDYSLKEGDTYETYSPEYQRMVKCEVLSVGDYTEGPKILSSYYDEKGDSMAVSYRYLRKWVVLSDIERELCLAPKTWIEGVGSLEGPFANLYDTSYSLDHLAYVLYNGESYLPFTFNESVGKLWFGCNMPTSEEYDQSEDKRHQLTYELEGNRLHVYGKVLTRGGRNNYAYFFEESTDDPLVRKLNFEIQAIEPTPDPLPDSDGLSLHSTNFYVPNFIPNLNYVIVDNQGEEHPVIKKTPQNEYRPFIEDGKVWQVGDNYSGNPVRRVEYYYFDGDTIIDGKTCKQMMCQRYVSPEHPDYAIISQLPTLSYIGAWYEENQKVYLCNEANNQFKLMYDFSVNANDTLQIMGQSYVIGPRQTRGINGFKGVYRDVMMCGEGENTYNTTWLEGVGNIDGPIYSVYLGEEGHALFLMSCTVGDEVIYYNDEYEDGATPEGLGARKRRFDFTHTIKTKPSARMRSGAKQSLYGEYNEQQLSINMNPIDDAYEVRITDESGKVVYERVVNAGSIVGLNVNISAYAKGRYTVTVENNDESFKGEFETQSSGIEDVRSKMEDVRKIIYNLQGQRLNTLQKGLNIVNGQKIYVK